MPAGGGVQVGSSCPFVSVATIAKAKAIAAIAVPLPDGAHDQRVLFRTSDFIRGEGLRITGDRAKRLPAKVRPPPPIPAEDALKRRMTNQPYFYEGAGKGVKIILGR